MHELPEMVSECVRLGEAITDAGYTVYRPSASARRVRSRPP